MKQFIIIFCIFILIIAFFLIICSCSYQAQEQTPEEALNQKVMNHTQKQINDFNKMNESLIQNNYIR